MRRPRHWLILAWLVALVAGLTPLAASGVDRPAARRAVAAAQADDQGIPGVVGSDACGLLTDDEVLRATGVRAIVERIPGSQPMERASCTWRLTPTDDSTEPWDLVIAIAPYGGRARFEDNVMFSGQPRLSGIGDDATRLFGQLLAVKGDVFLNVTYEPSGAPRPPFQTQRALAWLILSRLDATSVAGPSFPPMVTPAALTDARKLALRIRAPEFGADVVDATMELLARSGVGTYATAQTASPMVPITEPASPLVLLSDQVRAMALEAWAGGGLQGADLDELVPAEPDMAPASWIVAGYVGAADTLGAQVARELIGDQDWAHSERVLFPQLVLSLMTSDLARDRLAEAGALAMPHHGLATLALVGSSDVRTAQGGICSAVTGFISGALSAVFDALRFSQGGGGNVFKAIWNFVVSVAEQAVRQIVQEFGRPVLDMIARVAAAVGIAATIVSAIRPWAVSIHSEPFTTTKGVGALPGESGSLVATVDLGGFDEWPSYIQDCATVAGRPLPNLKPEGAPVEWDSVIQAPEGLVRQDRQDATLDARAESRLDFTTLIDDVREPWSLRGGILTSRVTVMRPALRQLRDIAIDQLMAEIPRIIRGFLEPYLRPTLEQMSAKLERLIGSHASAPATVFYHVEEPTPEPSQPPPTPEAHGWFVHLDRPDAPGLLVPGRTLELVSCRSPYGPWSGVYRLGGIIFSDSFTLPIVEVPIAISFPGNTGVQRTSTSIAGGWTAESHVVSWVTAIDMDFAVDGRTMTIASDVQVNENVAGNPFLRVDPEPMPGVPLPIEPAPAGMCR